jgi:hypothetical protein
MRNPSRDLVLVLAAVVAALPFVATRAADPSQFSVAEDRMFIDDHLRGLPGGTTIKYVYAKRGSLEAPIDDTARIVVGPPSAEGGQSVKVEYLSATRKLELGGIDAANANPVIPYFLEREVREMNRLTGGSANYFRKRIRVALAESARVEAVTLDRGSRRIAATEIRIAPYRDDPARSRYEKFAEKTYVFTLSDQVPGKVVELRGELRAPADMAGKKGELLVAETLSLARDR